MRFLNFLTAALKLHAALSSIDGLCDAESSVRFLLFSNPLETVSMFLNFVKTSSLERLGISAVCAQAGARARWSSSAPRRECKLHRVEANARRELDTLRQRDAGRNWLVGP